MAMINSRSGLERRAITFLLLAGATATSPYTAMAQAISVAEREDLIRRLQLKWTADRVRQGRLADERQSRMIQEYEGIIGELLSQVATSRAERDRARDEQIAAVDALTKLQASLVDRDRPGTAEIYRETARRVVEQATPEVFEALDRYASQQYIVYYSFEQNSITPEMQTVLREAAVVAKGINSERVIIVGHANEFKTVAKREALARKRTLAIADFLVGEGVDPSVIAVDWKVEGEGIPTGDGVMEPIGRRASIDIGAPKLTP